MHSNYNYSQLQAEIERTEPGPSRYRLEAKAVAMLDLVNKAVRMGLREDIAKKKSGTWLKTFIQTRQTHWQGC